MDESSEGDAETEPSAPGATDRDVEAAVNSVEDADASPDEPAPGDLPDEVLNAPTSAEEADHTLLEEYERENEPWWKTTARKAVFWGGATAVAVAVTLTAVVSLRQSGLSDGLAFILASVGMAVMVGFVFLSLRR